MSQLEEADDFYAAGRKLARYIADSEDKEGSTATLQALIRDYLPQHEEAQEALRSIVARSDFLQLVKLASRGQGGAQKGALIESLKNIYSSRTVEAADRLLCGVLGIRRTESGEESEAATRIVKNNIVQSVGNESITFSPSVVSENIDSEHVSGVETSFEIALKIHKRQRGGNLRSASSSTSGRGLFNYVLRDSYGRSLARVPLAMIDAHLRTANARETSLRDSADQPKTASGTSQIFLNALRLARRMGNGDLTEASDATSSKGLLNYTIRDSNCKTLAKVPLSMMLKN